MILLKIYIRPLFLVVLHLSTVLAYTNRQIWTDLEEKHAANELDASFGNTDSESEAFINEIMKSTNRSTMDATGVKEVMDRPNVPPTNTRSLDDLSSVENTNQIESTILPDPKFVLKINVILEHTNENKDKERLVEVERNIVLTRDTARALKRSINLELSKVNDISWVAKDSPRINKRSNREEIERSDKNIDGIPIGFRYGWSDFYEDMKAEMNHLYSMFSSASKDITNDDDLKNGADTMWSDVKDFSDNIDFQDLCGSRKKRNAMKVVGRWRKERAGKIHSVVEFTLYEV